MEELLLSLNSKLDTMSAGLTAIKTECKALREEFSGVAPLTSGADDKNMGLAERTSMKQIFEEMLFELKAIRQQRTESVSATKPPEVSRVSKLLRKAADSKALIRDDAQTFTSSQRSSTSFPVMDIAFPQGEEESLLKEMEKLKKVCRVPVDGNTVKRWSREVIGTAIPNPRRLTDYFSPNYFNLELANYSRIQLSGPKQYIRGGSIQGPEVLVIRGQTIEVIEYKAGTSEGSGIAGVLSYKIGSTASRLTVQFDTGNKKCGNRLSGYEYYLGLAFTPEDVPVDSKLFDTRASLPVAEFCTTDSCNANRSRSGHPSEVVIRSNNLLAVAEFQNADRYVRSKILRVDVIERIAKHAVVKPTACVRGMRHMKDGSSMLDTPEMGNIESCITGTRGCAIEVENQLSVALENFSPFVSRASHYALLPPQILSFTREMFYASDESYTEGMFSYDIASTNLQLSVVFRVSPENNCFAIAFASKGSPTDAASLNSFTVHEPWKTRPYIFAMAADGEQVLEFRNLRLTANMTTPDKSVLKVVVSAF